MENSHKPIRKTSIRMKFSILEADGLKKKKNGEEKGMGTFQRPASRPYFFVISSAEGAGEEDGVLVSSVFSLRALTLKRFKLVLEGGIETQ